MKILEQFDLFQEVAPLTVSIDESAHIMGVSSATIRNWLKTGYLKAAGRGQISESSLSNFQKEIAGKEKLNRRANKSFKDSHDHERITSFFLEQIKLKAEVDHTLGQNYEDSLSNSFRNKEGIYYTPPEIVRDLFTIPKANLKDATFCDPCCGSGNFIMQALKLGFEPRNVYGYDTDPVAVEITAARIRQYCGYSNANIQVGDFLRIASEGKIQEFDYILTNPPWGKKLTKDEKKCFGRYLSAGAGTDTCALFFFASLKHLKQNGMLGLLLPEAFFNIAAFENARIKALNLSLVRLVDYGRPFKGILSKAHGLILSNSYKSHNYSVKCESNGSSVVRAVDSFIANPKFILNFGCDQDTVDLLYYLFSIPHITLHQRASWGLGIVTGNNGKFIRDSSHEGYIPVSKGSDISRSGLKPPSNYIPSDFSLYQQVAPRHLFEAKEKLIYKFISSSLRFYCDTQQRFVLNSANMVIPNDDFPLSTRVLGELLNSDFMNWIFTSIFNTKKILRADLESLPIHSQFFEGQTKFDENLYLKNLNIERKSNGAYRIKR